MFVATASQLGPPRFSEKSLDLFRVFIHGRVTSGIKVIFLPNFKIYSFYRGFAANKPPLKSWRNGWNYCLINQQCQSSIERLFCKFAV